MNRVFLDEALPKHLVTMTKYLGNDPVLSVSLIYILGNKQECNFICSKANSWQNQVPILLIPNSIHIFSVGLYYREYINYRSCFLVIYYLTGLLKLVHFQSARTVLTRYVWIEVLVSVALPTRNDILQLGLATCKDIL